uniref:transient receptor potential cation channel subfamily V member 1-like n=1 Tax=Maylandia zebra TaxID=106582 RepID=UPI000C2426D5|nr:transient receptor potential cation channel subfamily V member 1-like [Maylandia zebra]
MHSSLVSVLTTLAVKHSKGTKYLKGDATELHGLLDYLRCHDKRLTSPEFTDETNGKTALLKALLNLKGGNNNTIEVILDIAEKTGDLENLINASYTDPYYKGQTALHVAIERRSFEHVKLLVQKGADVQAKANGKFFQRHAEMGFYSGELPLSLAACTNQPDIVSFLMENPYRRADVTDRDSQGNTVLHTLVVIADNTKENTDMIAKMYDEILVQQNKLDKKVQFVEIENNDGMTPLKLAAKLGKIELFRHMLHREFMDEETRPLSRRFTEWVYGPVHSSLYDMTSIDTNEENSVLEIIIFGSEIPNRPEMLQIEPLRSLLQNKWERFASKLFLMNFLLYVVYLTIFTAVALHRKDGKAALLICVIMYGCGQEEYVGLLVLSLLLAWVNFLYYLRGSKQLGMYGVMMQRFKICVSLYMILRDLLHFLSVYCVLLFGFSAAFVALIRDPPTVVSAAQNLTADIQLQGRSLTASVNKLGYRDVRFTILEMFKFTIGMGDLQFTDDVQYKEVYHILLISYIVLTYILLLNMLIALMSNTVERLSNQSKNIWNLQVGCC